MWCRRYWIVVLLWRLMNHLRKELSRLLGLLKCRTWLDTVVLPGHVLIFLGRGWIQSIFNLGDGEDVICRSSLRGRNSSCHLAVRMRWADFITGPFFGAHRRRRRRLLLGIFHTLDFYSLNILEQITPTPNEVLIIPSTKVDRAGHSLETPNVQLTGKRSELGLFEEHGHDMQHECLLAMDCKCSTFINPWNGRAMFAVGSISEHIIQFVGEAI